jgi:hypothetical protein
MTSETPAGPGSRRTLVIVGVVLLVLLLAGGGYALYKKNQTSDPGERAAVVAQRAFVAVSTGDPGRVDDDTTANGRSDLAAISADEVGDMVFGGCSPTGEATRACIYTRPGGQLTMVLVHPDDRWLVDDASVGPAGLPPTSTTT